MKVTGKIIYSTLVKVSDDGNNTPLDVFNFPIGKTGMPQAKKPNVSTDPDYIAPAMNPTLCSSSPNTTALWVDTGGGGCSSSSTVYEASDTGLFYFIEQIDTNARSVTYNQKRWVRKPSSDSQCDAAPPVDTTPVYAYTGVSNCSTSSVTNEGTDGQYRFIERVDTNGHSDTYNQKSWVRDSGNDSMCEQVQQYAYTLDTTNFESLCEGGTHVANITTDEPTFKHFSVTAAPSWAAATITYNSSANKEVIQISVSKNE